MYILNNDGYTVDKELNLAVSWLIGWLDIEL
jgi:hypothetical protein